MTAVPYPTFVKQIPIEERRLALPAVGKCRIDPQAYGASPYQEEFRDIVKKNVEQAQVDTSNIDNDEEKAAAKKLKKKFMKQGVAMASKFLRERLQLDVSIVLVEIVIASKDMIETDGCIAACFLDAGCHAIVSDANDPAALDAAKIPQDRLVAQFSNKQDLSIVTVSKIVEFCNTVSVALTGTVTKDDLLSVLATPRDKKSLKLVALFDPSDLEGGEDEEGLASIVGEVLKSIKDESGTLSLIDPTAKQLGLSYAACLRTDREDGLFTTVVATRTNEALGLVYSSKESIVAALESGRGVYYSRSRKSLWRKGDTSGHFQTLHRLDVDCDGDALRFLVTQRGDDAAAFCHLNTLTCWGKPNGLRLLEETLQERLQSAPEGSYTKRLFDDEQLLRDKLVEEAQELSEAQEKDDVAGELADVLYFAMVRATKAGVSIDDAVAELDRRTRKVTRRKGDSKAFRIAAGDAILNKTTEG